MTLLAFPDGSISWEITASTLGSLGSSVSIGKVVLTLTKKMADSVGSDSAALGKEDGTSSQKHCTACRVPVKDHIGPHGKEKCVLGVLKSLRERISALEEVVEQNELRHAEELREQSALHAKRVDSLMALIENLQQQHSTAADVKVPEAGIAGSAVGRDGVSVVSPSVDEVLPTAPDVQASALLGLVKWTVLSRRRSSLPMLECCQNLLAVL